MRRVLRYTFGQFFTKYTHNTKRDTTEPHDDIASGGKGMAVKGIGGGHRYASRFTLYI
ncbi:unnamed protein product, partial [Callosobruchus maculatus]